jgi:diguanylate cyclase (GGDEF)-like protein/PAS domain S-box-containing protein
VAGGGRRGRPAFLHGAEGKAMSGMPDPHSAEVSLRLERDEQSALNTILRISLEDIPLVQQFERVLDILLSLSWLPLAPSGGVFLVEDNEEVLVLKAQRNLAPALLTRCARVPFGYCLCGRAAATREIQFASCVDARHDITYHGIGPHGHYNVPILSRNGLLGVVVLYLKDGHVRDDREMEFLGSVSNTLAGLIERKQMEEALRQTAVAFENTSEGVMIADGAGRIVSVNRAFTEITGYAAEEVLGGTAALLRSGRHGEDFYAVMRESLREAGRWQGEIWDRRKNGDIFPAWLNISVVKDEGGSVTHHVAVFADISAMKESQSRIDHLAHHDALTGLPNRLLLNARMGHSLAHARRNATMLAVLFLDLDHFKVINDTLGHPAGDALLQEVAHRLGACVREEDTVSRLGGDEFTVLLEGLHDSNFASEIAQRIIESLSRKIVLQGHEVFVTCSVGISIFPSDGDDITTLLKNADSALYRAKEQGRDNYQYYTEELTLRAMARLEMETSLRQAMQRDELVVHYQPQIDLYTGRIIGMEALLRWRHPERGLVGPGEFISLAEETGLIVPIGEWVLRSACSRLKAWIDAGLPAIRVAVNLSSRQFNQKNLYEMVAAALRDTGLAPECLDLELTESLMMKDPEAAIAILTRLKSLGVQLSIDDFGTGYSSLSYLKRFPIDRIKIDQSFVNNITTEPKDAAVSQAIISMSHSLQLKTVAEGVETTEQQEFLRARQCDEVQGFNYSRPVPEQEMERLLREGARFGGGRPAAEGEGKTLLLVDDEVHVLDALNRALRTEGYRILRAGNPAEALRLLATNRVGVIVSDHRMPEMSGIELLRKIKTLHPDTVRIMLTGCADMQTVTDALNESEVFKILFKPWSNEELRGEIRNAFHQYERLARPAQ